MASSHSSRSSKSSKSSSQSVNCLSTAQMTGTRFEVDTKAFDPVSDDFTWAIWVKPFSVGHRMAMEQFQVFNGTSRIRLSLSSANEPNWSINSQGIQPDQRAFVSGSVIPTNDWTFLAGTNSVATSAIELFVNGSSVGTDIAPNNPHLFDKTLNIGNSQEFPTNFDGQLAFAKLYTSTLTPANITELYNGGIPQCFDDLSPALTGNLINSWNLASWDGTEGEELTEQVLGAKNLTNVGGNSFVVSDLQIECSGSVLSSCSAQSSKSSKSSLSSVSSFNSSSSDSSSSSLSSVGGSSQSSGNNVFYLSKFLGNSISVDGECVTFTREIFERREVRSFLGIVSGFSDCNDCFSVEACGTPNDFPTLFGTLSWTDSDITKTWLGCTWTNGEMKEIYAFSYGKYYNSTIFPSTTGFPTSFGDGSEFWNKYAVGNQKIRLQANPIRLFERTINNPPTTLNVFNYKKRQYQEIDIRYRVGERREWIKYFSYVYAPGPPTGGTLTTVYCNIDGSPVVVTGLASPAALPTPTNNRLTDGMKNGEMLYASGLRIKWQEGNGW